MSAVFPCLLVAQLALADPVLLPPSEARQASRDELLVGLPAVDRRGLGLLRYLQSISLNEEDIRRVRANIALLGSDDFRKRDRAMSDLMTESSGAIMLLRQAVRDDDLERQRRAELCLNRLENRHQPGRTEAALRLLARRRPPGSRAAVLGYLPWATEEALSDQALSTLIELGPVDASEAHVCERALESNSAPTRAGAGLVLSYLGDPTQKSRARTLLGDSSLLVRLLCAHGLAAHGDREAIAELVQLTGSSAPIGSKADRLLAKLTGNLAPNIIWENDAASRSHAQLAWRSLLASWHGPPPRCDLGHELSPTHQAQDLARRFIEAIVAPGHEGELKRLTGLPFLISGLTTLRTRDDIERIFLSGAIKQAGEHKRLHVHSLYVMRGEEYLLEAPEDERTFLHETGLAGIRAVLMEAAGPGQRERGVLLLRCRDHQLQVIGFGQLGKGR